MITAQAVFCSRPISVALGGIGLLLHEANLTKAKIDLLPRSPPDSAGLEAQ